MKFIILLALIPSLCMAGQITTTYRAPTKYTDGTAIDAAITYRLEGAPEGQTLVEVARTPLLTVNVKNLPAGRWCNRVVAMVNNIDADPTETVCVTIPSQPVPVAKKPNPAYGISTTASP